LREQIILDKQPNLPLLDVPGLLRRYGLKPDKSLGQNFLVDPSALKKVIEAGEVTRDDLVLEVGPGLGSLTRMLAIVSRQVTAVEVDADLIDPLQEVLAPFSNVKIIHADILDLDPAKLMAEEALSDVENGYLVIANIPYYITSALIRHLLEARVKPKRLALTVQKEVAARISAAPGDLSLLALSVQVYGKPRTAAYIPAGAFYPPPNVDSAVVRIDIYPEPAIPRSLINTFFRLAKAGFSQKRKTLRNALAGGMAWKPAQTGKFLEESGIDPMRRAETLSLEEWGRLAEKWDQEGMISP
jgi:16S rRNA (adenine1518-N6/adenine1519-N6)-dimethyltransferase